MMETYNVTVVTNTQDLHFLKDVGIEVNVIAVAIERKISPLKDLAAVFTLYRLFRRQKFDAVHSIMPKAGLLSMTACLLCRGACKNAYLYWPGLGNSERFWKVVLETT